MRFPILLCSLFVLGVTAHAADPAVPAADPSTDELLTLQAAQAESLDSLNADVDTEITGADGSTVTTQAHIEFDKVAGTTRIQKLDADGRVAVDIKTEGTQVSFLTPSGWRTVELDEQTQATLAGMGVDFGDTGAAADSAARAPAPAAAATAVPVAGASRVQNSAAAVNRRLRQRQSGLGGLGRLPKDKAARKAMKRRRMKDQISRDKKKHRLERRREWDRDEDAAVLADVDLNSPLGLEKDGLLTADGKASPQARPRRHKARALWRRRLSSMNKAPSATPAQDQDPNDAAPDAVLEMVDEDTGVTVEKAHFLKAERLKGWLDLDNTGGEIDITSAADQRGNKTYDRMKGVKHPFHRKKTRLPGWARRVKGSDGADLVEVQRMRVLKLKRVGDVVLPEESEQTDVTAVGEVKQRVTWRHK